MLRAPKRIRTDWKRAPGRGRGVRLSVAEADEIWEAFLIALATKSVRDVSKLPLMPSQAAFVKKRKRDPEFDRRAAEIMEARHLVNGGRRRIAPTAWEQVLSLAVVLGIEDIAARRDMPSAAAIYKRLRFDRGFAQEFRARSHTRCASNGEALRKGLAQNEIYSACIALVPRWVDAAIRDDVISELVLGLVEGTIERARLHEGARDTIKRLWRQSLSPRFISFDAPIGRGDGKRTIGDTIDSEHFRC
jgi:hypothetical protein